MSLTPKTPIPEGAIRYNTDSNKMEVWIGDKWMIVSTSESMSIGGRGFIGGAETTNTITYFNISTAGNGIDFGDLTNAQDYAGSCASRTIGLWGGGRDPSNLNIISEITIATTGNAIDFGDLTVARRELAGFGNQTRGLFAGGTLGSQDVIDYVTIATTGNAIDFGNLTSSRNGGPAGCSDSTRGLICGGASPVQDGRIPGVVPPRDRWSRSPDGGPPRPRKERTSDCRIYVPIHAVTSRSPSPVGIPVQAADGKRDSLILSWHR